MNNPLPDGTARIINGNALNLLDNIEPESVDLIITSPPYFALRSYQDGGEHYEGQLGDEPTPTQFVDALISCTDQMRQVLKPSGSIFVNLGDKYSRGTRPKNQPDQFRKSENISYDDPKYIKDTASENSGIVGKSLMGIPWRYAIRCIDELNLILRAEIIWSKPNGLPESVTDRVRRSHEQWFHFTKEPRYFSSIDEIREPYKSASMRRQRSKYTQTGQSLNRAIQTDHDLQHNPLGKLPSSVWTIPTEPLRIPEELNVDHFAAFPTEWPRLIILGFSPPNGVVLDPFGGTGTVAAVAKALGRHGIHNDLSNDYNRIADWRINGGGYIKICHRIHQRTYGTKPAKSAITETQAITLFESFNQ
jgi:site-specific DNA-methyltransferase (cytosine-N4-specific)